MRQAVAAPLADLRAAPGGPLDRQYAYGEGLDLLERRGGWARVRMDRDGLSGWTDAALGAEVAGTHRVATLSAHIYPEPDIKAPPAMRLPFGARIAAREGEAAGELGGGGTARFVRTGAGWIPRAQLAPLGAPAGDPVAVAEMFLGVPYLWGGDGPDGIDCSGLVQAALLACGIACPADSDRQCAAFGAPPPAAPGELPRGALLFWEGHVAMTRGDGSMIHANAAAMAVSVEGIVPALGRISAGGGGPLVATGLPGR